MNRFVVGLVVGGLCGAFAASAWAAEAKPELKFERLDVETNKDTPEACLVFSRSLSGDAAVHYEDYVALEPVAKPALRRDGERLCLQGLVFGINYQAVLKEGLPAADGGTLAADTKVPVALQDRPALVTFRDGLILPRETAAGVPVTTVNVERVLMKVLRVPDRLVSQINRNTLVERQAFPYRIQELEQEKGTVVWRGEMAVAGHRNETVTTLFPLQQAVPVRKPGLYVLVAEDAKGSAKPGADSRDDDDTDYRARAIQWVVQSDIALTSFRGADGLNVFARSLATTQPIPGIALALVARDNEELARLTTDADGRVRFDPGLLRGKGGAEAHEVMAYGAEGDFAFLDLSRPAFDLSDRGVDGRSTPGPVDAFLYTERGIYRPKETVHITTLLRDGAAHALAQTPVTLVVTRPDGVVFRKATLADQAVGATHYALELSDTAPRGHWTISAYLDVKAAPVGHAEFEVQDFVPQLLKVTLAAPSGAVKLGDNVQVEAEARFLYGAPASGLEGEAEATIAADPEPFADYRGFRFGLAQQKFEEKIIALAVGKTDDAGKTTAEGELKDIPQTTLPLKATIRVAIFEPGGRTTDNTVALPLRTRPLLIGIRPQFSGGRVAEDTSAGFEVVAVDGEGKPVARPALAYKLVREVTEYTWYRTERGGYGYERWTHDVPVTDGTIAVGADQPAVFSRAQGWGYYRLTVLDRESGAATSVRFSSGWTGSLSEDRPDRAEVSADKPRYAPGETAKLAIRPPSAGEALVIIANDRVLATKRLSLPADGATVEMPVTAEWGTGAYAIVTTYRPLRDANERAPVRSIGVSWLPIDPAARTLTVELGAPDRTLPRHRLDVPVTVRGVGTDQAYITVAAIDEGILQLTRFPTPAPTQFYFGKRRLAAEIRDDYGLLITGTGPVGAIRGGGDAAQGGRGLDVVPTKTIALFSGLVALDAAGHATIPLEIPDFNGELRLMAVAFDAHKLGMAEGHLVVRDPVVSDVTFPRFLAPGDSSRIALSLHNVEGASGPYQVRFEASGAVTLSGETARELPLAEGQHQLMSFPLRGETVGIGTVDLHLRGPNGFAVDRQWQIAVRPPQAEVAHESVAALGTGKELRLDPAMLDEFLPGTGSVTVNVASYRTPPLAGLLQSLDRYPFGCIEQTTSRAFPLVFFNDLALLGRVKQDRAIEGRVQGAVDRVLDMQKLDGHFGMWSAWS